MKARKGSQSSPDSAIDSSPKLNVPGIYLCLNCRRNTHHSLYDSRDNTWYNQASDEELKEVATLDESDILKCDTCVENLERELRGEEG